MNQDTEHYEYSVNAEDNERTFADHPSIRFFSQDVHKGKTFEYDLILSNPNLELLLTNSMSNKNEIKTMMEMSYDQAKDKIKESEKWDLVKAALDETDWEDDEKKKHLIAARYLDSIGKGENALELCLTLEDNFELEDDNENKKAFIVPSYIHEALEWLLR